MKRAYLRLHLWLKAGCERLTMRQRRVILITVCSIYFISCIGLIIPMFISEKETEKTEQTEIIKQDVPELIDTPILKDSLYQTEKFEQSTT